MFKQHWSAEDIRKTFMPGDDTFRAVRDWLKSELTYGADQEQTGLSSLPVVPTFLSMLLYKKPNVFWALSTTFIIMKTAPNTLVVYFTPFSVLWDD